MFGYISASDVLRRARGLCVDELRLLSKKEILKNQTLLGERLPEEIASFGGRPSLLDAQNVVDNGEELIELPLDTLEVVGPRGIILLESPASEVYLRRANDPRARPMRTAEEIAFQMRVIRLVTERYATRLNVPMVTGVVVDTFKLDGPVGRILSTQSSN
jgi:adenylate kinase